MDTPSPEHHFQAANLAWMQRAEKEGHGTGKDSSERPKSSQQDK